MGIDQISAFRIALRHGKQIESEREPGLPSGSLVTVNIELKALTLAEKRQLVDELCGAWADDPSIVPIFKEIECQPTIG